MKKKKKFKAGIRHKETVTRQCTALIDNIVLVVKKATFITVNYQTNIINLFVKDNIISLYFQENSLNIFYSTFYGQVFITIIFKLFQHYLCRIFVYHITFLKVR